MRTVCRLAFLCIFVLSAIPVFSLPPPTSLHPNKLDFGDNETELRLLFGYYCEKTLNWRVTVSYCRGDDWLSADTRLFRMGYGEKDLTVSVNRAGLEPGTYTAMIEITAVGAGYDVEACARISMEKRQKEKIEDPPATIPVLPVVKSPVCFLSPSCPEKAVPIENDAEGSITWSIGEPEYTGSNHRGWISCSPGSGRLAGSTSDTLTVSASHEGLPPGVYRASIPVNVYISAFRSESTVDSIEVVLMVPFCWNILP